MFNENLTELIAEQRRKFAEMKKDQFLISTENGFLPREDPLYPLPQRFAVLESLLQRMPLHLHEGKHGLLWDGKLGEAVHDELPQYDVDDVTDSAVILALFRDYTFLASAYLLEPADLHKRQTGQFGVGRKVLPKNIAVPLCKIAAKLDCKPFMEYAQSYALANYARLDRSKPVEYDNLRLIRSFSGLESEKGFILVHVDMVRHSPDLVKGIQDAFAAAKMSDNEKLKKAMALIGSTMSNINEGMEQMWKRSNPADYMRFRTFIMGTKNQDQLFPQGVIYEGVSKDPTYYRGESGANDSIIPTMDNFLELTEKMPDNDMTAILKDFRSYRPKQHTLFLSYVENTARKLQIRDRCMNDVHLLKLYIYLLEEVREFRARHWSFAREYIIKRTAYPTATGGSPLSYWLPNQLKVVLDAITEAVDRLEFLQVYVDEEITKIYGRASYQKKMLEQDVDYLVRRSKL